MTISTLRLDLDLPAGGAMRVVLALEAGARTYLDAADDGATWWHTDRLTEAAANAGELLDVAATIATGGCFADYTTCGPYKALRRRVEVVQERAAQRIAAGDGAGKVPTAA